MATGVQEHIRERVSHLARPSQHMNVVAIGQHRTASTEDSVHRARHARADGLHSGGEIGLARRFDDRMQVVVLD